MREFQASLFTFLRELAFVRLRYMYKTTHQITNSS